MSNSYFQFKQFTIHQENCAMKVCTDACLFGAWVADKLANDKKEFDAILDIGTGSGLLSLLLAQKLPGKIDAIELDEMAAEQAAQNMEASPWKNRLQVIYGDARTVHLGRKYDLIVSNPPFFENDLKSNDTKRNLALHCEALSLEELLIVITKHLLPEGKFSVLLPYHRSNFFTNFALEQGFFLEEEGWVKQSVEHDYFRVMLLFGQRFKETVNETMFIRNGNDYSSRFIHLLKDYYLKL